MIVQAIALLDDLDKELNTYAMRVKEWYGWHFPEMGRIVNDNLAYAKVILKMGLRSSAVNADLAEILPEEIETAVKAAAEVSMGTEITPEDLENIQALAEQVVSFTEYRQQLSSYLSARMTAIAPNLTALVGELVGARLIAHAGSLMNLAKSPASTIQILGAEKALFRALKTKHDTPKYGLIYHASLIGQATGKNKGKIARMLATKAALGLRVDALADWSAEGEGKGDEVTEEEKAELGVDMRGKIERRLRILEGKPALARGVAIGPNGKLGSTPGKWEVKEARKYNPDADGLAGDEPAAAAIASQPATNQKSKAKKETKLIQEVPLKAAKAGADDTDGEEESDEDEEESDEEMEDEENEEMDDEEEEELEPTATPAKKESKKINGTPTNGEESRSITLSTVSDNTPDSPDSPTPQERNWQSSITGNTKVAKKARKIERHERKLELSAERSAAKKKKNEKLAKVQDREDRRLAKAAQVERRADRDNEQYAAAAAKAGLSVARYKRKLERGEIKFEADGTPVSISKKDIKRMLKAEKKDSSHESEKKRKRVEEESAEMLEKKKRKSKL